jgi:hypothetical protein
LSLSTQKAIQTAGQKNGTCAALIQKIASAAKCTYSKTPGQKAGKNHPFIGVAKCTEGRECHGILK